MKSPQTGSSKVAADGSWSYTPKKPIDIGNQSVTITTIDEVKKPIAITHLFEIMKSGTQVLGTATPSGTIAPTVTPVVTKIPTITVIQQQFPQRLFRPPLHLQLELPHRL